MNATLRPNTDLDREFGVTDDIARAFDPQPVPSKKEKPVTPTNGHTTTNRMEAALATTAPAGGLIGLLEQLGTFDIDTIDAELTRLTRQIAVLNAVRSSMMSAGIANHPKDEPRDEETPTRGGITLARQQEVVLFLAKKLRATSAQIAKSLGIRPNGLSRFLRKDWLVKSPGHYGSWSLSKAGQAEATRLQDAKAGA
ncbi:MAG: hypothetical protein JWO38_1256 [Gemmataceae bacterium]|nr:hypothetical protein [Gemmataceae bacterium]